jgi:hypothetical protein
MYIFEIIRTTTSFRRFAGPSICRDVGLLRRQIRGIFFYCADHSVDLSFRRFVVTDPISSKTTIDGEFIYYWTKPLSKTLSASIATRLYSNDDDEEDDKKGIDNIDLVLGGDHGARKF